MSPEEGEQWRRAFIVAVIIIAALVVVYARPVPPEVSGVTRWERP